MDLLSHLVHWAYRDWLAERSLSFLGLMEESVLVLGVHRADGRYIGVPTGDTLVIYGPKGRIAELDRRPRGISGGQVNLTATSEKMRLVHEQQ